MATTRLKSLWNEGGLFEQQVTEAAGVSVWADQPLRQCRLLLARSVVASRMLTIEIVFRSHPPRQMTRVSCHFRNDKLPLRKACTEPPLLQGCTLPDIRHEHLLAHLKVRVKVRSSTLVMVGRYHMSQTQTTGSLHHPHMHIRHLDPIPQVDRLSVALQLYHHPSSKAYIACRFLLKRTTSKGPRQILISLEECKTKLRRQQGLAQHWTA